MKLVIAILCILGVVYSANNCNCGNSHAFNRDTYKCVKFPQKAKDDGYVEGCDQYGLKFNDQSKWECLSCKPSYKKEVNDTCTSTGVVGCIEPQKKTVQMVQEQVDISQRFLEQAESQYDCNKCEPSKWYLKDRACVENPKKGDDFVKHCIQYQYTNNKVECVNCETKYYLDGDKKCKSNPSSPKGCLSFQQVGNDAKCTSCDTKKYILGKDDQCVKIDTIKHCAILSFYNNKYLCGSCQKGYYNSVTMDKCIENPKSGKDNYVKDCEVYGYEQSSGTTPICKGCKSGKATSLDHKSCVNKDIQLDNCWYYQTKADGQECYFCKKDYQQVLSNDQNLKITACKKCPKNPDSSEILKISFVALALLVAMIL